MGFHTKKPAGVPHKFSEEKQRQFIEYYERLKTTAGDEPVLFLDAVHPTQTTKLSDGWILKGQKKTVETTGSRTRLNIPGALNLNDIGGLVLQEYQTINDFNISRFFNEIRVAYPNYHQKIHLILDGAGYNQTQLVKDWAGVCNIELHYLPPYSPNLNPIERVWKVMNEQVRNNRYFANKHDFREGIFGRDADLLIAYALHFGCNTWQKLMSSALSAMKPMAYDVTDIQYPVPNVTYAGTAQRPSSSTLATLVPNQTHTRPLLIWR